MTSSKNTLRMDTGEIYARENRSLELFEHISSGVAVYKAIDEGSDFVFLDLNPAGERMENVSRSEVVGRKLSEVFPAAEAIGLLSTLRKAWKKGTQQKLAHPGKDDNWRKNTIYKVPSGEIVSIFDDVTEHRLTKQTLLENHRLEVYESLLDDIAGSFVTLPPSDAGYAIKEALKRLGILLQASRCYVVEFQEARSVFSQTFEWCAPGIKSMQMHRESVALLPWATLQLFNNEILKVSNINLLPQEASCEQTRWQEHGIQALLAVPIRAAGKVMGLLALDVQEGCRDWDNNEVRLVKTVSEIFGTALDNQKSAFLLHEREKRLAQALELSNEGAWEWNVKTGDLTLCANFFTMLGYSPGEFPPTLDYFKELMHPDDRLASQEKLNNAMAGKRYENEFRLRTKAGDYAYILSRGQVVEFDNKGRPCRLVGTHIDISARRHYENRVLKVAEGVSAETGDNFFRTLVKKLAEVLGANIVSISKFVPGSEKKSRILTLNDNGVEIGGFEYKIAGSPCELLLREGATILQEQAKEQFPQFPILQHKGFEAFSGVPIKDSSGEVVGSLFAFFEQPLVNPEMDLSLLNIFAVRAAAEFERDQRESDLRQSQRRYKKLSQEFETILDGIADQICLLSPELDVLWSNRPVRRKYKAPPPGSYHRHCYEFSEHKTPFCDNCSAAKAFATGETQHTIFSNEGKFYGVKFFPVKDDRDTVTGVISMCSDITENKRLQEEAERTRRLASLGEVAAGVAHEINNPNALILLNATVIGDVMNAVQPILNEQFRHKGDFPLGKMPYSRMNSELPRLHEEIVDSARKIRTIVDELREFVKQDGTGKIVEVNINTLVDKVVRMVRKIYPQVTIEYSLAEDLPVVLGNSAQLEQVLTNLLQNAVDALDDMEGKVFLITKCSDDGVNVNVEIYDDGIGIPAENLDKITDPFFTTKRELGGTGLGLSISARIVKEHQGQLLFCAREQGTLVKLELPVAERSVQ